MTFAKMEVHLDVLLSTVEMHYDHGFLGWSSCVLRARVYFLRRIRDWELTFCLLLRMWLRGCNFVTVCMSVRCECAEV